MFFDLQEWSTDGTASAAAQTRKQAYLLSASWNMQGVKHNVDLARVKVICSVGIAWKWRVAWKRIPFSVSPLLLRPMFCGLSRTKGTQRIAHECSRSLCAISAIHSCLLSSVLTCLCLICAATVACQVHMCHLDRDTYFHQPYKYPMFKVRYGTSSVDGDARGC